MIDFDKVEPGDTIWIVKNNGEIVEHHINSFYTKEEAEIYNIIT